MSFKSSHTDTLYSLTLLACLYIQCAFTLSYKDAYPYLHHSSITEDDSYSPPHIPPNGIPIGSNRSNKVFASTNGLITFDRISTSFEPETLNETTTRFPFIAVYWTDLTQDVTGAALYYASFSAGDSNLLRASAEVRNFTDRALFNATWMFIATWHNTSFVCAGCSAERLTIQAIVVTDEVDTYAMLNYIDVQTLKPTQNVAIGWEASSFFCQHPVSFTDDAFNMSLQPSNTKDDDAVGYLFYDLTNGKRCRYILNECNSNPCSSSATCLDGVNNYTCVCEEGFTGRHCEIDIDDCASQPCNNSATCLDGVNNYTCVCGEGFTGRQCEIDIDDCASQPCNNSATCLDGVNNYTCVCYEGFIGRFCAIRKVNRYRSFESLRTTANCYFCVSCNATLIIYYMLFLNFSGLTKTYNHLFQL